MGFNRFTFTVLIVVLVIAGTSLLMAWSYQNELLVVAKFTFTLLWGLEIAYLLHFVTRTNRSLRAFLESLHASDFVRNGHDSPSFDALNLSYNEIVKVVQQARSERESQYHYFQYTLEFIPVGVLSFDRSNEQIELFNYAAQELLGGKKPGNLSELNILYPLLAENIRSIIPGKNQVVDLPDAQQQRKLLIRATDFTLFDRHIRVVSLQNIKKELEAEELLAWQKLISVLRHEVMNSAGPLHSLSRTVLRMFKKNGKLKSAREITDKTIRDAVTGLESIEDRTHGMISFIQSYRELTKIPEPQQEQYSLNQLTDEVMAFMGEDALQQHIKLENTKPEFSVMAMIDRKQVFQVLINLVKNAMEAFPTEQKGKKITLHVYHTGDQSSCIAVEDNGPGVSEEVYDQMFIPFYTTKENGSGIGLNMARQIMTLHQGRIFYQPADKQGSVFVLEFSAA